MANNTEEKILDIKVRYDDAIRGIAKYRTELDELKKAEKTLQEDLKEGKITREEYNVKLSQNKIATAEYKEAIRACEKEVRNNIKAENDQQGSLVSLRASLSNLTKQYDQMSAAERNSAAGQDLKLHINSVTEELKGAEEGTQRFYRNVGNYEASILKAMQANVPFIGQIANMTSGMGGATNSFIAGGQAAGGLNTQLLTLAANPVVAILALISSIIMLVSKGIKSSEEASNRWSVALAPLNRGLEVITLVLQQFAGLILSVVEAGAKMMNWIGGLVEKLPIVGDKMKEVNDRNREAIELEKEIQKIEKQRRDNEVQNAKDALSVAELRVKAKDKEKFSAEDRLAFIKEANRLEEEQSQRNVEIAERELAVAQEKASWAENDVEANRELAKLEADVYNARREYFDRTQRLKQNEMTLINEVNAERKAEVDAAKQAAEQMKAVRNAEIAEIRKAEDEMLKLVKDDREQQTRLIKLQYGRQIEDLKKKLTDEKNLTKAAREAINSQILSLEQQCENALEKQSQDVLNKELDNRAKLLSLQLESVAKGSEQEYQLKMNSILAQRDMEIANKELTEQMKLAITEKYNTQMDELSLARNNELLTKQQEAMRIAFETEIAQSYGNQEEILRIKMEQKLAELEALQQMEGESMEAFNLRRLRKENEYMDAKQDVADKEIAIEQAKYAAMNDITNGLIALTEQLGESDRGLEIGRAHV